MKKIYQLTIMFIMAIIMLIAIPRFSFAENTSSVSIDGVYITSNEGTYKTGDTISFEVRFSEDIEIPLVLRLKIKIGENSRSVDQLDEEGQGKIIKYSYTIKENDSGKITFESLNSGNEISVKNLEGDYIDVENNVEDFQNSINININEPVWTEVRDIDYSFDETTFFMNIPEIQGIENHTYHLFVTFGNEKINIEQDEDGKIINSFYSSDNSIQGMFDFESALEKSGDIYVSIVEEQQDYSKSEKTYINKIILENKKIERPEQKGLTKRIYAIFFDLNNEEEENLIFVSEPHNIERKLNVYVGKITDVSILNSIKNKESDGMSKLLNYAKNNSNESNKYTLTKQKDSTGSFLAGELINNATFDIGEYYYMYYVLDNENGKYISVEDIGLFYAVSNDQSTYLSSQDDSRFEWKDFDVNDDNNNQDNSQQDTQKPNDTNNTNDETVAKEPIPHTGLGIGLLLFISIVLVLVITMYKKVNYYKGI